MATISVSTFDTVEIKEDQKTEFKRSIFIDPETQTPGAKQMRTIAETIAAFMNAEGGMLYVGISDEKNIIGIDDDLNILANQAASVVARSPRANDDGYTYGATADKYEMGAGKWPGLVFGGVSVSAFLAPLSLRNGGYVNQRCE